MKKIIRVFIQKTNATPDDENVRINTLPGLFDEADEVHISVVFTWDMKRAEYLAERWKHVAPVFMGGPAFNQPGGEFIPGMYMKKGFTITSRGCINKCWFCSVHKRENGLRELEIKDGWKVQDDNLLACSEQHIRKVFAMLARQENRVELLGGLEASLLKRWHVEEMKKLNIHYMYFAYDTPNDLEPLIEAGKLLRDVGFTMHPKNDSIKCYVLCGYKDDTFEKAEKRMNQAISAGFAPYSMLWRGDDGVRDKKWMKFQAYYSNPLLMFSKEKPEDRYKNILFEK